MWKKGESMQQGHVNWARGTSWKQCVADEGDKRPGESNRQLRRRILESMAKMAALLDRAFTKANKEDQENMKTAIADWIEEREKMAKDPTYHASVGGFFLSDHVDQYLSQVCEGVNEYFICRGKESEPLLFSRRIAFARRGVGVGSFSYFSRNTFHCVGFMN